MFNHFFSSSATETLRRDLRALADDTSKLAQSRLITPAMESVRHARAAVVDRATAAERFAAEQCNRISQCISANPFAAVAVAFVSGFMIAGLLTSSSRRA